MKQSQRIFPPEISTSLISLLLVGFGIWLSLGASCKKEKENNNSVEQRENLVSVKQVGAIGDGQTDDTRFFQAAIDSLAALGGGTVWVPAGNYMIDADISIKLKSHVTLKMDTAARLICKPNSSERSYILMVLNAKDVNITGGNIVGDRAGHTGTTGEWGMGIAVYSGSNVVINGTKIYNCWGDGIVIGSKTAAPYYARTPSTNVVVKNVVSDNNRRQGITIGRANGVVIDSCRFTNTNGTKPMTGIDIEPDKDTAQNITITNSEFAFNKGCGVEIYVNSSSVVRNVVIKNNFIHHNTYGGYIIRARNVEFTHNRIIQNKYNPAIKALDTSNCIFTPNTLE